MWPFLLPVLQLGASAIGGLFKDKSKQQTSSSSTSTPTVAPAFQGLQQLLIDQAMQRLQSGGLPAGYETQGITGINKTFGLADLALQNRLRS